MITQISSLHGHWEMNAIKINIVQLEIFQWLFQGWSAQIWSKESAPKLQRLKNGSCVNNALGKLGGAGGGSGSCLKHGFWSITSLTKDWIWAHGNKALSLNHWTTREFQYFRNVIINMGHQTTLYQTMILLYNSHLTQSVAHMCIHTTHTQHFWSIENVFSLHSAICNLASNGLANLLFILVHTSTVNMVEPNL